MRTVFHAIHQELHADTAGLEVTAPSPQRISCPMSVS